jgi:hypothetical protein
MESLPKPLIVLIGSIIEEYEHFTWNSTYLGDKMRISLVWTRGELINRNNGKKHKSPSKIERDNRRSDTWHEKQESNKITKYVEFHVKCSYSSIIEPINTTNGFGKLSIII